MIGVQAFGAFVCVGPGCEGLVHVSELDTKQLPDASLIVKVRCLSLPSSIISASVILWCLMGVLSLWCVHKACS